MKPQHVHHADGGQTRSEQIGTLSQTCSDEQAAIAAPLDGKLLF